MNSEELKVWLLVVGCAIGVIQLWVKFLSARVKLQTDLRLLKIAREAGIDTRHMEAAIGERMKTIYRLKGSEDEKSEKSEESIGGSLFLAVLCLMFMWGCIRVAAEGFGKTDTVIFSDHGDIVIGILLIPFCAYGMISSLRDATRQALAKIAQQRQKRLQIPPPIPEGESLE